MEKKNINSFPKNFFSQSRTTIKTSEALKDCKPLEWGKNVSKKEHTKKTKFGKIF